MLRMAADRGYELTDEPSEADVILVNTCAFILDAQDESVQTILEMAEAKKQAAQLIVAGCLAERYKDEIKKEIPEVTRVITNGELQDRLFGEHITDRIVTTGGHFAYLKIAEGCDKMCTYCIIPHLRGHYRSVPMEDLVKEAEALSERGVKELILVAQETTVYGKDLYGKKSLTALLKKLSGIEGIRWIRVMYMYPEEITEELLEAMASLPKVCHYFDIPIQHASDPVLKAMGRRTDRAELERVIAAIRKKIPDAVLRTTLISGFPGETEEDHRNLLDFVKKANFDRLGVFCYSREEGTPAAERPDQVEESVKQKRREEIMLLQQKNAFRKAAGQKGRELSVMVEGRLPDEEGNIYVGRTYMDAPDVDGYLYFDAGEKEYMTGDMIRVLVTGSNEYDLIGEAEGKC
ncbi:MAG: 30S ribosomal protein S12 methylthiotransferase RimO [Lachnospiraceae bacterium]|nr:30S ribosomal protein S12 methylthiotransferase RimO [Lachnospiraceae bacterium]